MQRWIVIGVLAVALLLGGGAFAYKTYKDNRPYPIWVPMPINPETPVEQQDRIIKTLKQKLPTPEVLTRISKDLALRNEWQMSSDEQCVEELKKRIFIRIGERETSMGKVPTIDVGLAGKFKERDLSGKITKRLMQDVWKILGIEPPPAK